MESCTDYFLHKNNLKIKIVFDLSEISLISHHFKIKYYKLKPIKIKYQHRLYSVFC